MSFIMKSSIYTYRPLVMFDPNNTDHRFWLGHFTKTCSWGQCPVKFHITGTGNSVAQMQLKLLQYYTEREFNEA